jgi:hypothetical protein
VKKPPKTCWNALKGIDSYADLGAASNVIGKLFSMDEHMQAREYICASRLLLLEEVKSTFSQKKNPMVIDEAFITEVGAS